MGSAISTRSNLSTKRSCDDDLDPASNVTCTAKRPKRPSCIPPSSNTPYTVFISHAGEDKATIAIPLRQMLLSHGITAFVDETDIGRGADAERTMIDAMESAKVAVIVLSPEFVVRKWPIKELICFLKRKKEDGADDPNAVVIIPFFYRLSIKDLYREPRLDRRDKDGTRLCEKSRFFERMKKGQPEANISTIESSLQELHGLMGVRNDFEASNGSSYIAHRRRGVLLRELCDHVRDAVKLPLKTTKTGDPFLGYFDATLDTSDLVFNFGYEDGKPSTCSQEARLLKLVLDESQTKSTSIVVRGFGGVGKTSLIRGISCMDVVMQRFKDGVYYLSLGVDGTKRDLIDELSKAVEVSGGRADSDVMRRETKIENVIQEFRSWFEFRKCLFLVDDVWQTREIPANIICELLRLHVSGAGSKVLLTTRTADIASMAGSYVCLKARGNFDFESRSILMQYAGIKPDSRDDHRAVNEILERCGGLPLFLAVSGKAVRTLSLRSGHEGCEAYRVYARKLLDDRQTILKTATASHARLDTSLSISLDFLEERKQDFGFQVRLSIMEMYRRLFVLRKRSKVPLRMLRCLWELEADGHAALIAAELENAGLADLQFEKRDGRNVELLCMHDSLHEFASMETQKHDEEKVGHDALLNEYSRDLAMREGCHEWWRTYVEADGYIHANLCRHLLAAGRIAELVALMLSPQWAKRQVEVNSILFFDMDLLLTIKAMLDGMREASRDEESETRKALELISEAVALSFRFVASNIPELCFQLHGRLKGFRESCRPIEKYVGWIETDPEGPMVLCDSICLAEPGELNMRVIPIGEPVTCMAVMKGGEHASFGCADGRIFVVDVRRAVVERRWKAHSQELSSIVVSQDGTRIVSGSCDKTAKVWDVNTGCYVTIFEGHCDSVSGVAVLGDGRRVISVSFDGFAFLWNIETGQNLSTVFTGPEPIYCVAMLGAREAAVMGGDDKKLRIWNLASNEQGDDKFDSHEGTNTSVAVAPDGKLVVSGSWDGTVRVWDAGSHQQIGMFFIEDFDFGRCLAVSEDGRRIFSTSSGYKIQVRDLESGTQICESLEGHTDIVTGVAFLKGADRIVSCSRDRTVRVWDVTQENKNKKTKRHRGFVTGVSFTPNGNFVVSASWDNSLRIWNTTSGQQVGGPLRGHSNSVTDVALTPNGRFILSVSEDETLCVWDFVSRKQLLTFTGHTDSIQCVAVTPQGEHVVTGSRDKSARAWDLATMNGTHFILGRHNAGVARVVVSDDGLRIISVDCDDEIFVWELETQKLEKQFKKKDARRKSRREVLDIVGETTAHDDTKLSISRWGHQIVYGDDPNETILATMEAGIFSWALSPSQKRICVGLEDGQVAFLNLVT